MKKLLTLIILVIISTYSIQAQLSFSTKTVFLKPSPLGGTYYGGIIVRNNSGSPISIVPRVIVDELDSNWFAKYSCCSYCVANLNNQTMTQMISLLNHCEIESGKSNAQDWNLMVKVGSNGVAKKSIFKVELKDQTNNKTDTLVYVIGKSLSFEEKHWENTVKFYPNPVQNELYIDAGFVNGDKETHVTIIDILGHVVKRKMISGFPNSFIDVSDLRSGIYFLVVEKEGEIVLSERFFKNDQF